MDALRQVNREDGITVLTNLHHLDTARHYCDRIVAMQSGRVMFDGTPAELTAARVREIYGVSEDEFEEQAAEAVKAKPGPARAGLAVA
jgi:phosphonate transport system ATP-binding protein